MESHLETFCLGLAKEAESKMATLLRQDVSALTSCRGDDLLYTFLRYVDDFPCKRTRPEWQLVGRSVLKLQSYEIVAATTVKEEIDIVYKTCRLAHRSVDVEKQVQEYFWFAKMMLIGPLQTLLYTTLQQGLKRSSNVRESTINFV